MSETFVGYVVKYALAGGVQKITFDRQSSADATWFYPAADQQYNHAAGMKEGRDFARTYAEACMLAEAKRVARIKGLTKQIKKLEALRFNAEEAP